MCICVVTNQCTAPMTGFEKVLFGPEKLRVLRLWAQLGLWEFLNGWIIVLLSVNDIVILSPYLRQSWMVSDGVEWYWNVLEKSINEKNRRGKMTESRLTSSDVFDNIRCYWMVLHGPYWMVLDGFWMVLDCISQPHDHVAIMPECSML